MPKLPGSGQPFDLSHAAPLLSQQIWCWGQDILRPEGNWLLELGFGRTEPPTGFEECPSAYKLVLSNERCVVLRGFGMFFGDAQRGCIFLPRYAFEPQYTTYAALVSELWCDPQPPKIDTHHAMDNAFCASLLLNAVDWIHDYEVKVVEQLGISYRRSTLTRWVDGRRTTIPAEQMINAWRDLKTAIEGGWFTPGSTGRLTA